MIRQSKSSTLLLDVKVQGMNQKYFGAFFLTEFMSMLVYWPGPGLPFAPYATLRVDVEKPYLENDVNI